MNKIIPITLGAVIAIAMVFALAPMDYASTAHVSTPSAATVTTVSIADDAITAAKIAGSNTAVNAPIAIDSGTGTALTAVTSAFTPAVSSQALVWCTWEGLADTAAITDGLITLTTSGNGVILGSAARNIDEAVAAADFHQGSDMWIVTGITTATTFTCTLSGTGVADADVDNISAVSMIVPE